MKIETDSKSPNYFAIELIMFKTSYLQCNVIQLYPFYLNIRMCWLNTFLQQGQWEPWARTPTTHPSHIKCPQSSTPLETSQHTTFQVSTFISNAWGSLQNPQTNQDKIENNQRRDESHNISKDEGNWVDYMQRSKYDCFYCPADDSSSAYYDTISACHHCWWRMLHCSSSIEIVWSFETHRIEHSINNHLQLGIVSKCLFCNKVRLSHFAHSIDQQWKHYALHSHSKR